MFDGIQKEKSHKGNKIDSKCLVNLYFLMKKIVICFSFIISMQVNAIEPEKIDSVHWPMQVRLPISGTFAEFRNSHLHMGCDYKTYGINGFSVLSVYDGNITSMSYASNGYGKN